MSPTSPSGAPSTEPSPLRAFQRRSVRAFHAYANWLVGISWKRFFLLALLLMIATGVLQSLPPFSWRVSETVVTPRSEGARTSKSKAPAIVIERAPQPGTTPQGDVNITVLGQRVRITPAPGASAVSDGAAAPSTPSAPSSTSPTLPSGAGPSLSPGFGGDSLRFDWPAELPPDARKAVEDALSQARERIRQAAEAQRAAEAKAAEAESEMEDSGGREVRRTVRVSYGEALPELAFFWILASAILKSTYKGRVQAEVKAAQATETAEAESLKRQVLEARVAAMQAQVEPHFLFNTLASIDHLIETDPPRASAMQKNLIALLRASMPSMREAAQAGSRDLGRELMVIRPYLEILKVRMEDRLAAEVRVPSGLLSAEFPSMMLQSLVENAIKHGLEPKAEGGELVVQAEVAHGRLVVSVSDSGLGFGKGSTVGTGVGLANIRERLSLLYGSEAQLRVEERPGGGTVVSIELPYRPVSSEFRSGSGASNQSA